MIALSNPLYGWRVNRDEISMVGSDPRRPECILAEPDGTQALIAQQNEQAATAASVATTDAQQLVLRKTLPNGLAFDRDGDIVIANFGTDTIELMTRDGASRTLYDCIDDGNPDAIARYETHYANGTTTPELMGACRGTVAPMMASLTFGGADLRTVYLGSLGGSSLASYRSPRVLVRTARRSSTTSRIRSSSGSSPPTRRS